MAWETMTVEITANKTTNPGIGASSSSWPAPRKGTPLGRLGKHTACRAGPGSSANEIGELCRVGRGQSVKTMVVTGHHHRRIHQGSQFPSTDDRSSPAG